MLTKLLNFNLTLKTLLTITTLLLICNCSTTIRSHTTASITVKNNKGIEKNYEVLRLNEDEENYYDLAIKMPKDYTYITTKYADEGVLNIFIKKDGSYERWSRQFAIVRDLYNKSNFKNMEEYIKMRNRKFVYFLKPHNKITRYNKSKLSKKLDYVTILYDSPEGFFLTRTYEGKDFFWVMFLRTKTKYNAVSKTTNDLFTEMNQHFRMMPVKKNLITEKNTEAQYIKKVLKNY